ncbi:TetR/AcrR family transcriptional regulator [Mycobacterium alsense]|uniref:TetR/AcrR family transcriptional regulator n=1 Tax=Mycobacterium alsense TaxID=324058 RepID=A0AA42BYP1_9MYCO|nr:TetR/AcrR family transcriptional regulator [Mycobacterium alsense]
MQPEGDRSAGTASTARSRSARASGRPRDEALDEAIILATRERLVRDGYSKMTIGDIAADAQVTRPTLYRRWKNKFDLVVDALDYGFRKQDNMYTVDLSRLEPRDAFLEAVRRLDPAYYNPNAILLMGNFAGESVRTPELLEILRRHGVEPRVDMLKALLRELQRTRRVRSDADVDTIATMCFGSYLAAFYRGDAPTEIPDRVVAVLWPALAAKPARRGSSARTGRVTNRRSAAGGPR